MARAPPNPKKSAKKIAPKKAPKKVAKTKNPVNKVSKKKEQTIK